MIVLGSYKAHSYHKFVIRRVPSWLTWLALPNRDPNTREYWPVSDRLIDQMSRF